MTYKLTQTQIIWMNEALKRADQSNDVKTKVDADGKYIRTPWGLCEEIVRQIAAQSPLRDKQILVVDTVEFIPVLLAFGAEHRNITYVAPYGYKGVSIAGVIGVRVVQQSLLDWKSDMKFDVIVGNPPYQDEYKNPLYYKFHNRIISKHLMEDGIFAFITPDQMSVALSTGVIKGCHSVEQRKILVVNVASYLREKYFGGVGSTFCYYIIQNSLYDSNAMHTVISDSGCSVMKPSLFKTVISSDIGNSILSKCFEFRLNAYGGCWSTAGKKAIRDDNGTGKVVLNIDRIGNLITYPVTWREEHKLANIPKVFIAGFGTKAVVAYDHALICAIEKFIYTVPTTSDIESENLVRLVNCNLQRFFTKVIKARGPFVDFLGSFKRVDLSKSWTDAELYAHFGLTQEEIDYIESIIK